jgi:5-formyltetrahydrofolate cyclo-ligase
VTGEAVAARKRELRDWARGLAGPSRPAALAQLQQRLLGLAELEGAWRVALYAATAHEACLGEVAARLLKRGVRLAFPRVVGSELWLLAVSDPDSLSPGHRGIPEPGPEAERVPVAEIDVFLVPGLLFDRAGRRLGRGGGHYDRLLRGARSDAVRVGICYAERLLGEIPAEERDVSMDLVVTESELVRAGGAR